MCIQLLRFAMFRSCCQQVHCQSRTDWAMEFCNFCIEFCKKPSRKTFLMQVFAGLCTGKVTLSYLMLQNTGQNVQKIDASGQRPIDQRTIKGDKCYAVDLANNAGHLNSYNCDKNSIIFFSVHVIQSVIQWGKNHVVVVKRQDDNVKRSKRTNIKKFTILYQGPRVWNCLPASITNLSNFPMFKSKMLEFLLK